LQELISRRRLVIWRYKLNTLKLNRQYSEMSLREKIAEFFGLKKSMVALLAMVVLVGLGEKMAGMFGLYYLLRDIIVSIGAFGGAFLW
jgi:hypothetical protein